MDFSEILFLMAIALILFGPEDLPDIARTVGKIIYELRKATGDLTREFQNAMESPVNTMEKAFEQMTKPTAPDVNSSVAKESTSMDDTKQGELLTYDSEDAKPAKDNTGKQGPTDPLAELPSDMVSYEEKITK